MTVQSLLILFSVFCAYYATAKPPYTFRNSLCSLYPSDLKILDSDRGYLSADDMLLGDGYESLQKDVMEIRSQPESL